MGQYLIEEPAPFAPLEAWLAVRDDLTRLPQGLPEVAEALAHAEAQIAELRAEREVMPGS